MLLFNVIPTANANNVQNFNTSNVTIQPTPRSPLGYSKFYFNTSNVTIQRTSILRIYQK